MTDTSGIRHQYTLPVGHINPVIWSAQQTYASTVLPPQFSELVQRTKHPFIQVITDVLSPKHVFMDGKVVLVGDALAGLRPHTAASTSQAAMNALMLEEVFEGRMELEEWERRTGEWARWMSERGREMGDMSQFGRHPLADDK